jgi:hypothetical protein
MPPKGEYNTEIQTLLQDGNEPLNLSSKSQKKYNEAKQNFIKHLQSVVEPSFWELTWRNAVSDEALSTLYNVADAKAIFDTLLKAAERANWQKAPELLVSTVRDVCSLKQGDLPPSKYVDSLGQHLDVLTKVTECLFGGEGDKIDLGALLSVILLQNCNPECCQYFLERVKHKSRKGQLDSRYHSWRRTKKDFLDQAKETAAVSTKPVLNAMKETRFGNAKNRWEPGHSNGQNENSEAACWVCLANGDRRGASSHTYKQCKNRGMYTRDANWKSNSSNQQSSGQNAKKQKRQGKRNTNKKNNQTSNSGQDRSKTARIGDDLDKIKRVGFASHFATASELSIPDPAIEDPDYE